MKLITKVFLILVHANCMLQINAQVSFSINNLAGTNTITCVTRTINLTATTTATAGVNYTWTNGNALLTGSNVNVVQAGNYTVTAASGSLSSTKFLAIGINTVVPVSTCNSTFLVTGTVAPSTMTISAISPTINIVHSIYPPMGGTITGNSITMLYSPQGPGVYTYCLTDMVNGCATCSGPGGPFVPGSPGTTTAVKEENTGHIYKIWPNPGDGFFQIESEDVAIVTIDIYTLSGELIRQTLSAANKTIDIRDQKKGLYIVRITGLNGVSSLSNLIKE